MSETVVLRPYQDAILEKLREAFRQGHRSVLLYAPTGAGKTEMAISLLDATNKKYKRGAMILDRIVLCNQTSARLQKYNIDHGVMQAGHWRHRPYERIQVASAQTIEKRGTFPGLNLLIVDECFAPDVEILTERGFFRFDQLPRDVRVAQFDTDGAAISFVHPTEYIDREHRGPMVHLWQERGVDLLMTPEHELLIRSKTGRFSKRPVATAKLGANDIPVAGAGCGHETDLSPHERLMIALQADGSLHTPRTLSFSFMKDRKTQRLLEIVKQCWLRCHETPVDKRGRRRFLVSPVNGASKLLPDHFNIAHLSREKAAAIIDEMVHWDGHVHSDTSWYYSSTIEANTDFFQAVAILAGYRTNKVVQHDDRSETFSDVHRLFIQKTRDCLSTQSMKRTTVDYDGRVYCVRVPAGNIIVRRNGKPVVIGNCHTQRQQTIEFIKNNEEIKVVGLSASPFADGLGNTYSAVVSAVTTKQLVDLGNLVPLRVFVCKEVDMTGAKKVAGEWTQGDAAERAMKITGDVVAKWVEKTTQIFGGPRKTIVFCSNVAHGADLAEQFSKAGYNFVPISYKDSDEFKKDAVADFEKPDSAIHGLIACDILTKGFDVPDVMIGVSARPFTKSFMSHVQQMGRVMRPYDGKEFALWLDHSGNYLRFQEDWDELYHDGVSELKDGKEKPKKEKTTDEKEAAKCPQCQALWIGKGDVCSVCGYHRPRRNVVEVVDGEMEELKGAPTREVKQSWYSQLMTIADSRGYSSGWVAHKYREKFGVWPRNLEDVKAPVTQEVMKWETSRRIAWAKAKKAA